MDSGGLYWEQIAILLGIAIAVGWLAGVITRGGGFGVLGDIAFAICGAFAGAFLFNLVGIEVPAGYLGLFIKATAGAVVLLLLIRLIKRI